MSVSGDPTVQQHPTHVSHRMAPIFVYDTIDLETGAGEEGERVYEARRFRVRGCGKGELLR